MNEERGIWLVFLAAPFVATADPPTEDKVWGYATTTIGVEVFDDLTEAESDLRTTDAAHSGLVATGDFQIVEDKIRITYRADPHAVVTDVEVSRYAD